MRRCTVLRMGSQGPGHTVQLSDTWRGFVRNVRQVLEWPMDSDETEGSTTRLFLRGGQEVHTLEDISAEDVLYVSVGTGYVGPCPGTTGVAGDVGKVYVGVVEASNLVHPRERHWCTPYVTLALGETTHMSRYIDQCLSPVWNDEFVFDVWRPLHELQLLITVWDHREEKHDKLLGQVTCSLSHIADQRQRDQWYSLRKRPRGAFLAKDKIQGEIHLRLRFAALHSSVTRDPRSSTAQGEEFHTLLRSVPASPPPPAPPVVTVQPSSEKEDKSRDSLHRMLDRQRCESYQSLVSFLSMPSGSDSRLCGDFYEEKDQMEFEVAETIMEEPSPPKEQDTESGDAVDEADVRRTEEEAELKRREEERLRRTALLRKQKQEERARKRKQRIRGPASPDEEEEKKEEEKEKKDDDEEKKDEEEEKKEEEKEKKDEEEEKKEEEEEKKDEEEEKKDEEEEKKEEEKEKKDEEEEKKEEEEEKKEEKKDEEEEKQQQEQQEQQEQPAHIPRPPPTNFNPTPPKGPPPKRQTPDQAAMKDMVDGMTQALADIAWRRRREKEGIEGASHTPSSDEGGEEAPKVMPLGAISKEDSIKKLLEEPAPMPCAPSSEQEAESASDEESDLEEGTEAIEAVGVDPHVHERDGLLRTPLHRAAGRDRPQEVADLLARGADPLARDTEGRLPLHFAAMVGGGAVVQLLLMAAPDSAMITGLHGRSALMMASEGGYEEAVVALLGGCSSVQLVDADGRTALHLAASSRSHKVVSLLLEADANPNVVDKWGNTPLHHAAEADAGSVVTTLLKAGADPNAANTEDRTPLHTACMAGETAAHTLAAWEGVNVNVPDKWGQTPLHVASDAGRCQVVSTLIEHGAQVDLCNVEGRIPLHFAAVNGHATTCLHLLGAKGSDVNARDKWGQTALHGAAAGGHQAVVAILLDANADSNQRKNGGRTPLHFAASKGHVAVIRLLLGMGADPSLSDDRGVTPLDLARQEEEEAVVSLLEKV